MEHAWGVVISTDTAFLVGALALVGPRVPRSAAGLPPRPRRRGRHRRAQHHRGRLHQEFTRCRSSSRRSVSSASTSRATSGGGRGPVYATLAIIVWLAFLASGVHPTLAGVAIALLVPVYRPNRRTSSTRSNWPARSASRRTPSTRAPRRTASASRSRSTSGCSRRTPRTSRTSILPLFALANAGVRLESRNPRRRAARRSPGASSSGLVVGKFVGVFGSSRAPAAPPDRRLRPGADARPHRRRRGAVRHRLHDLAVHRRPRHRDPARRTRRGSACSRHPSSRSSSRR